MESNNIIQTNAPREKHLYLECLRILAVFFVIFNHTGYEGFLLFTQRTPGSAPFWIYLFFAVFCKFSVGLFFAISGALLLGREQESLAQLWKKRISKIFLILLIFSIIYYVNRAFLYGETLSFREFFRMFYEGGTEGHLWYLYGHITFLISLPFFRAMVKHLDTNFYLYMIALSIGIYGLLPILEYLLWQGTRTLSWHITVPWLSVNTVFYPLLGYFLHHKVDIHKNRRWLPLLWTANIAGILLSSYMTYYKGVLTGVFSSANSQTFLGTLSAINIICIFLTVKYLFEKKSSHRWMLSLGSCTFGIYLIHVLVLKSTLSKRVLEFLLTIGMNDMIAVLLQCLAVLMLCYLMVYLFKRIRILFT